MQSVEPAGPVEAVEPRPPPLPPRKQHLQEPTLAPPPLIATRQATVDDIPAPVPQQEDTALLNPSRTAPPPLPPRPATRTPSPAAVTLESSAVTLETPPQSITPTSPSKPEPTPSPIKPVGILLSDSDRRTSLEIPLSRTEIPVSRDGHDSGASAGGQSSTAPRAATPQNGVDVLGPHPPIRPRSATMSEREEDLRVKAHERAVVAANTGQSPPLSQTTFGLNPLQWAEVAVILMLTLTLFGGKRFAFIVAVAVAPLLALWLLPRPQAPKEQPYPPPAAYDDSVRWINETLRTLFPLISTDILAPFIDLLEDALIEQVPPIVTSVRCGSVSLGAEPLRLTSMKTISDSQWFAGVSDIPPDAPVTTTNAIPNIPVQDKAALAARQEPPSASAAASRGSDGAARRTSRPSSGISDADIKAESVYHERASELAAMRKRDRLVRRIRRGKRHLRHRAAAYDVTDADLQNPESDSDVEAGQFNDPTGDEGEGMYVNFEVSFAYRRSDTMLRKGTGLHMLAHFGWGVKGIGGSEIPVYIDVVELRGTIRLRLLLSPTPPFAREASFSFVEMPMFEISARPLRSFGFGSINAMDIPLLKTYVQKSIAQVAATFVSPKHYTMDVDRLLLGHEAALRPQAVGVLYIIIHSCSGLPKTDTMGTCDPYIAISYSKFNKPLFSTRTVVGALDPIFEENAFILVNEEQVQVGEKLKLRVCDSDRFSADDTLGIVELDVGAIISSSDRLEGSQMFRRRDDLAPEHPGMRVQGQVDWSLRFYPLWKMPDEEFEKRIEAVKDRRGEGHVEPPPWLKWIMDKLETPDWEKERQERRQDTVDFFTGERARDEMEAAAKPSGDLCSGVLQFHIHQCADLELESLSGTFSGQSFSRRRSAASGKPALNDVIDRAPTENPDPPSPYCEVHLNDKFVYRTRTKKVNPMPYFNAVSERFVRDWRMAKIVFVIRDERDREHNPILGVVALRLKDVLADRSQFTRWFPILGGLGWGRLRISLLFKPFDMRLPQGISSFEACTLDITKFASTDIADQSGKQPTLLIETENDRAILHFSADENSESQPIIPQSPPANAPVSPHDPSSPPSTTTPVTPRSPFLQRTRRQGHSRTSSSASQLGVYGTDPDEVYSYPTKEWDLGRAIRLAVKYRHSCSVLFSVVTRRMIKKTKVHAIGVLRLNEVRDNEETQAVVPIFATALAKDAVRANEILRAYEAGDKTSPMPALPGGAQLIGFVRVAFVLHPGISRAHRKLGKRDHKFRAVYEAWEATRLLDRPDSMLAEDGDDGEDDYASDTEDSEDDGFDNPKRASRDAKRQSVENQRAAEAAEAMREDDTQAIMGKHFSHSKALHRKNHGIFQLKLARTGKLVKDKVEAKILATMEGTKLQQRPHGADMEVEHEGQSRL